MPPAALKGRVVEWFGIAAGVIAGIGSGFLSALATPFVQRRAEEAKTRQEARRDLVARGRALVVEAAREGWDPPEVARDGRYLQLRPHLSQPVRETYRASPRTLYAYSDGRPSHVMLADAIDVLEKDWKLI